MSDDSGKRNMFDLKHPMFKPLWARLGVIALCGGWALFEFIGGEVFWALLFGAAALFLVYGFFFSPDRHYFSEKPDNETDNK